MYTATFMRLIGTPHRRAVRSLDPIANTCRPNRVYRSVNATSTASTTVIQMPVGSHSPLPSRAVRSRLFSQVTGASIRRSSARPFAAPRTRSIVPSVTMNGTTRSWVTSSPLTRPQSGPGGEALAAAATAGPCVRSVTAVDDRAQRDDRSDRQVDASRRR